MDTHPDVIIIGAGPVGLVCSIAAAESGLRVELAEPQSGAIDKCCSEGMLPGAVSVLHALGIDASEHGQPLAGIAFVHGNQRAEARFTAQACAVRRTTLHHLLRERACSAGVRITAASARLAPDFQTSGRVCLSDGTERQPRWVVGADGVQSLVRRAAGLERSRLHSRRFGLRQHFRLAAHAPISEFVELHWAHGAQVCVMPMGFREIGVSIVADAKLACMDAALEQFPALRARLAGAGARSSPRGAMTLHRTLETPARGRVALVGDASGSVDAITADGLSLGFAQALALGKALAADELSCYVQAHRRLMLLPRLMSGVLLFMGSRAAVTRGSMAMLARVPGLYHGLLRMHTQQVNV